MTPDPTEALRRYLEGENPSGRPISQASLARLIEVTPQSFQRYMDGRSVPSPARRLLIDAWSDGAIPAAWWETEQDRIERRVMAKLARLYPEYQRRRAA